MRGYSSTRCIVLPCCMKRVPFEGAIKEVSGQACFTCRLDYGVGRRFGLLSLDHLELRVSGLGFSKGFGV